MANFMLIHGAWHGGWCWHKLVAELSRRGHRALAPDLQAHGHDATPRDRVTLDAYADSVIEHLNDFAGPVCLVGHSMGGMVISAVGQRVPERLERLVYLCAFVPADGMSLLSSDPTESGAQAFAGKIRGGEDGASVMIDDAAVAALFYHDCTDEDVAFARARLVPQPSAPLGAAVALTDAAFGSLAKSYIECTADQAAPIAAQRAMYTRAGIDSVVSLSTSHSPFFSAPTLLADSLEALIGTPA
jgi:pimeloyl-ACP methyl ester carboxylesterase